MADYSKYYEARNIIEDIMEKDFIGPVKEDEVLSEIPTQYYIMGKLYPQDDTESELDMARDPFLENETETYDASISLSNKRNPSSLGITCALVPGISKVKIRGSYAFYNPVNYEDADSAGIDISLWEKVQRKPDILWKRSVSEFDQDVDLSGVDKKKIISVQLDKEMKLQIFSHAVLDSGERIITIVLVNENIIADIHDKMLRAMNCAFQVYLTVSGDNENGIFADINKQQNISTDKELLELEMLYSDRVCYCQGHGCSAKWDQEHERPEWIGNSWLSSYNLQQMMAGDIDNKKVLSMYFLSSGDNNDIQTALNDFIENYKTWIDNIEQQAGKIDDRYLECAKENISKCRDAYNRIIKAIRMLGDSVDYPDAMKAFRYANEAMLIQRKRTLIKNGVDENAINDEEIRWYPFQLAFILQELPSFIDKHDADRNLVDLLWFPTGGGKTEAYLGIAAFAIFYRRLNNSSDDGVTVIMRYTLRLLTLQQFERASMLICACELLREKYNIGGSEISIGLWVGGKLTPNKLEEARRSLTKQQRGDSPESEGDPVQIKVCPWCGQRLGAESYSVDMKQKRMIIRCSNPDCKFHTAENGLPVHIIDDEIYENLPDFIVATVDKFAQIPLSDKPATLFGISSGKNPPDLIIQDELHLISGPLGTMVGIYEAAITKLCEKNGIGAKIIASTATIRNAGNQILELYGKDFRQFPPQGINAKDSYFAVESKPEQRPARKYFGVMGIGLTATTTLIRVNAALLYATRYLEASGFDDEIIDNFWTITDYFNSLRELGGASTQIRDDVQSRFSYLAKTKFADLKPVVNPDVSYDNIVELTSRMDNSKITDVIQDRLKRGYHDGQHKDVYDFVLASNMISVGVDVGRLGIMVVTGQPKTNAEYIQASSRVGRDNPGMVVTVYNANRSRDRSHYEQFLKYHSALYRYVEATSLTPFADRARDRGLHALYVSLCRYLVPDMLSNESALAYNPENPDVKKVQDIILDYVDKVDYEEEDSVIKELEDIEDLWAQEATGDLVYSDRFGRKKSLLKSDISNDRFRTMNSMRNVDAQSGIYLLGRKSLKQSSA